ncbi:uncharacterized protein N7446_001737 [Penicillium canescens]|uniref:Uncharacterized protein n=1 Tax=Penicillium canescens TaxID=5083 RepID=A0AAD6N951_PENCN|nr:uncharacterized protein N7446_001737 [Penicillium canescens]KAJ6043539.1 hypothetical protein N7460_004894 [Penicillium canescens]KAJ6055013.1 hypothetical protein N7444_004111 [Penicillium canescens]KAJ6073960.1 hypothetical protein N7446_001737 [Penicillium canescens]KAJ6177113.1 hypothetical protein N7485_004027 [Penicillium canescens]
MNPPINTRVIFSPATNQSPIKLLMRKYASADAPVLARYLQDSKSIHFYGIYFGDSFPNNKSDTPSDKEEYAARFIGVFR